MMQPTDYVFLGIGALAALGGVVAVGVIVWDAVQARRGRRP